MNINRYFIFANLLLFILFISGCRSYPDYSNDFRFPIEAGDIAAGQQAFISLECHRCHEVDGVKLPLFNGPKPFTIQLGGKLIFAKTYADLATSIINPSHEISGKYLEQLPNKDRRSVTVSPMPFKNDMRLSEFIDIVAFLNSRYSLVPGYTEHYY